MMFLRRIGSTLSTLTLLHPKNMLRTGCSGETQIALHVPSSSRAGERNYVYVYHKFHLACYCHCQLS